jgi:hypothetical protein
MGRAWARPIVASDPDERFLTPVQVMRRNGLIDRMGAVSIGSARDRGDDLRVKGHRHGAAKRLDGLLGDVDVAEDPDEDRHRPSVLGLEDTFHVCVGDGLHVRRQIRAWILPRHAAKAIDSPYIGYQDFCEGPVTLIVIHGWAPT